MSEYFMHQNRKPLFAMALSSISLLSPYIFNISMTYFLLKGGQISRLLDSKCFSSRAMPSFLNHRWTVPVFFLVDQTSFLYLFMQYIVGFQENFHFFYSIIMYYTNQVPAVLFRLITYYKFCTWKALIAIEMSSAAESELDSYQFVHRQKPLYALELKSIGLITPYVFNFCMVYFLLRGGLIVRLLDSSCFHLPETKKHLSPFITSQWSLPVLFVVDHVAFVCVFTHYIYVFDYNKRAFFGIIMYFTQIVPSVLFRLTAYYKYLTWKALQSIAEQHTGKVVTGQKIANKVAELAILNKQLNSLFSPPLLLFTVFHSMQSLTLLVGMFSQGFQAAGLIIPLPIFTAAGGIVYFCKQIENSLSRIQSGDCFVVSKSNRKSNNSLYCIKSPFLRHFIAFYGNFGLHLRPYVSRHDKVSCLNYILNILFIILFNIFTFAIKHLQKQQEDVTPDQNNGFSSFQKKPLFIMALNSISILTPFIFNFSMFYFLVRGAQITRFIDSSVFCAQSTSKSSLLNRKWTVPLLFLFDQLVLLPLITEFWNLFKLKTLFFYGLMMVIAKQAPDVPFRLVAYYKYLTWKTLKAIEERHKTKALSSRMMAEEVSALATVNRQLNSLISVPLLQIELLVKRLTENQGIKSDEYPKKIGIALFLLNNAVLLYQTK
ncbi:hypothetical protein TYRP_012116 [Tyrophagus putrescentiae]|nr:hypothetical protein TYRP_012116 [Tyrophagus putrescentiae]